VPIANCFVRDGVGMPGDVEGLAREWSRETGASEEHLTINLVPGTRQAGAGYAVMARLHLPSLWAEDDVARLQVGLARTLARSFEIEPADVHVITSIVQSGHVVENGEVQEW
jgi:hypothetical protein